jgi:hypothetical protein
VVPGLDIEQSYTGIKKLRDGVWRFEGSTLQATLRSDSVLAVQYTEGTEPSAPLVFVALPVEAEDIIAQETARRETLLEAIRKIAPSSGARTTGSCPSTRTAASPGPATGF